MEQKGFKSKFCYFLGISLLWTTISLWGLYSVLLVLLILYFTAVETEAHMGWACVPEARLAVNDGVWMSTSVWCQGLGPSELHRLSSTQAGENKLGTKMEMIERKYARVDAKINYKTFTFKMRSWNSKTESANRVEWSRYWSRKLDIWSAFLSKGCSGHFYPPTLFFFLADIYWNIRHTRFQIHG